MSTRSKIWAHFPAVVFHTGCRCLHSQSLQQFCSASDACSEYVQLFSGSLQAFDHFLLCIVWASICILSQKTVQIIGYLCQLQPFSFLHPKNNLADSSHRIREAR
ncbi:hypothetical protein DUNSADRAFT_15500 [Dunaliella salina]|uniref:Secreted protein n=1 Tax=Dunaliella salina TaxID=3046 RepID=A0ABQ7H1Q8_DUNSA|nr:hypothetical protein DUNSADRAFT_15500 [Dunaliella salina]|eukprot:KAF5840790.1 hypothetical protein DUNSADRAFT_15500 [Dunaliella salina]